MKHTRKNRISPRTKWIREEYAQHGWPIWKRISRGGYVRSCGCCYRGESRTELYFTRRAYPDEPPVRRRSA